jgi:molybdopterin-guanine dinucleotide biosynthesis protein A
MGRPKAWLPFAGETMLGRVVRLLGEAVAPVIVVAAPGQDVPPLPAGVETIRDPEGGRGPLQGLAAGLECLRGRADGYMHTLAAVYRPDVAMVAVRLLAEGRMRPAFLFDAVPTRVVRPEELAEADRTFQTLRNLNTPAEYEAALREAGAPSAPDSRP